MATRLAGIALVEAYATTVQAPVIASQDSSELNASTKQLCFEWGNLMLITIVRYNSMKYHIFRGGGKGEPEHIYIYLLDVEKLISIY